MIKVNKQTYTKRYETNTYHGQIFPIEYWQELLDQSIANMRKIFNDINKYLPQEQKYYDNSSI
jgi:hypothetical protein